VKNSISAGKTITPELFLKKFPRFILDHGSLASVSNLIPHKNLASTQLRRKLDTTAGTAAYSLISIKHVSCRIYEREDNTKIKEENLARSNYII